jgi:hypothetical protein
MPGGQGALFLPGARRWIMKFDLKTSYRASSRRLISSKAAPAVFKRPWQRVSEGRGTYEVYAYRIAVLLSRSCTMHADQLVSAGEKST